MLTTLRNASLALLGIFLLLLWACTPSRQYSANAKAAFEIGGVCTECPGSRLDTLLRKLDGVVAVKLDSFSLAIDYDSTALTRQFIISVLNESGYDADDNLALLPTLLDPCCSKGILRRDAKKGKADIDDLDSDDDLNLADFEEEPGDGRNLDAMLDDELEGVLEDDLLNDADMNQAEDLMQNDAEDDLDDLDKANEEKEKQKDGKVKDNQE